MSGSEGLLARIRQLRRSASSAPARPPAQGRTGDEAVRAFDARLSHLEQLVEGLQDSVHREALRHDKRLADLEARIHPSALNQALSKDARERGL